MEELEDIDTELIFNNSSESITFKAAEVPYVIQVSGNTGHALFSIKPNGEFVPGPGIDESKSLSEFSKFIYKSMTVFGDSFSQTLEKKNQRIKELEAEIFRMKSI